MYDDIKEYVINEQGFIIETFDERDFCNNEIREKVGRRWKNGWSVIS